MSFKVNGFVLQFRGRGDNFEQFWDKFMVLAAVQKWDSDEKKMDHLPLFLDGDTFLVYTRMLDTDKKKPTEVKKRMEQAFSVVKAQAYKFTSHTLRIDESPDAYAADLLRLLKLSGHAVADDDADKDPVVVEQLLAGLPLEFARQQRSLLLVAVWNVCVLCERRRGIIATRLMIARSQVQWAFHHDTLLKRALPVRRSDILQETVPKGDSVRIVLVAEAFIPPNRVTS